MSLVERQRAGILIVLILSIAVYGLSFLNIRRQGSKENIPYGIQKPDSVIIELKGIERAGIYFLPPGMTSEELVGIANIDKFLGKTGLESFEVENGSLLTLSTDGKLTQGRISAETTLALGLPIDVNRVSANDLSLVPGIGWNLATQIILLREEKGGFLYLEELKEIPGIKQKNLNRIKKYLCVGSISPREFR